MLILQRKAGESLWIGDQISVSVLSVEDGKVRLAIDAPKEVPILRNELRIAMEANRDAAQESASPLALLEVLQSAVPPSEK
ncbi:carbon storage regulator CsrA [Pygmaiobacter massiliensis]|uniref:carbon storage regulator CsrA n=1 Tax=Pygmaiobacter massiliensis TaxID=1917873 RepID=UPI000C7CBA4E|nr:carbon storage regulator CsrA [Pygmaiobacter massiliensis]